MPVTPDRWQRDPARENRSGRINLCGTFVTSASGALVAASSDSPGFTLAKVGGEAGRYLVQFVNAKQEPVTYLKCVSFRPTLLTDDADAAYPAANGHGCHLRNATPALTTIHTNGQLLVQFVRDDTHADAEVADGCGFMLEFGVKLSSASP